MKYYAVRNGRSSGVYNSWADCESQVKGHSGSEYKSFKSQADANAYMNGGSSSSTRSGSSSGGSSYRSSGSSYSSRSSAPYSASSRSSTSYSKPASSSYSSYSSNDYSPSYYSSSSSSSSSKPSSRVAIYTDGASKNNQARAQGKSRAGYGVYYGPDDSRNHSGRVTGEQTNSRGELEAIRHALKVSADDAKSGNKNTYAIHTDSQYSKDSLEKWSDNWEKNGWKTSSGGDVANQDLIKDCKKHIAEIKQHSGNVEFVKVKGHSGNHGNDMADKLANEGCTKD